MLDSALGPRRKHHCRFLLDIHLEQKHDGLELLQILRVRGYQGIAVIVSGDSSKEQCFRAAKAGANDFLLKRPHIRIADEIARIFKQANEPNRPLCAAPLSELGYLRSFGLTPREIEILEEFTSDYCLQKELAYRVNKAPDQLRKSFSRIYQKLGVSNIGQVIHILTVCSMFNTANN
ncbi:MAG: response regulator transcription factor [Proteobacteria bacterium]|nr:response regulator transcription factor [Pseudomonadota bacterium]